VARAGGRVLIRWVGRRSRGPLGAVCGGAARLAIGSRVADLCTGTGLWRSTRLSRQPRRSIAFDICRRAVRCARVNALQLGVDVDVHLGSWARAVEFAPFDLVVCNPPYVPHDPGLDTAAVPATIGPGRAWNAGYDGRLVLDPLCEAVSNLLADRARLLLVQSEFAKPRRTLAALSSAGLDAEVIARQWIPFGPVLASRASWLERPIVSIPAGARRSYS